MFLMICTTTVIWLKLTLRVNGFSGFKLPVVSTNEAVITGKCSLLLLFFTMIMPLPPSCGNMITFNHVEAHSCGYMQFFFIFSMILIILVNIALSCGIPPQEKYCLYSSVYILEQRGENEQSLMSTLVTTRITMATNKEQSVPDYRTCVVLYCKMLMFSQFNVYHGIILACYYANFSKRRWCLIKS